VESSNVHPDLKDQHHRYKMLAVGLVISSILPAVTFFIFYSSNAGLAYLSKHLLKVMVAFILQIPLVLALSYFLAVKRMRFLERSSQLVKSGERQELQLTGAYKINNKDGTKNCQLDLALGDGVERFPVIPSPAIQNYVNSLPDLPESTEAEPMPISTGPGESVYGFIDPETNLPVAVELGGNVLWICPPAKML
jgi:heme/copper-type cytochrome/quinol oxidase subunit 4